MSSTLLFKVVIRNVNNHKRSFYGNVSILNRFDIEPNRCNIEPNWFDIKPNWFDIKPNWFDFEPNRFDIETKQKSPNYCLSTERRTETLTEYNFFFKNKFKPLNVSINLWFRHNQPPAFPTVWIDIESFQYRIRSISKPQHLWALTFLVVMPI